MLAEPRLALSMDTVDFGRHSEAYGSEVEADLPIEKRIGWDVLEFAAATRWPPPD